MNWIYIIIVNPFSQREWLLIMAGGIIVILLLLILETRTRSLRHSNRILRKKESAAVEVLTQRNLLSRKTRNMEDSLKYAQRIQAAMFTTPKEMNRIFPDSFIFQRPKDIVSGDFCWARKIKGKVFFSVVDCTGHGVPGAFMSLIGIELFRQIVVEKGIYNPSGILSEMNNYFDLNFGNEDDISLKDGMDLSFCAYDQVSRTLEFAGAFNPIYIMRNNEMIEVKADRIAVGPGIGIERKPFTNHSLTIEEDDILYMFSDGYADQFGGPEGKKFKYRRFRHLLTSIHRYPMEEQLRKLEENMQEWMGVQHDQIDDLMVIGIRPASCSSS